MPSFNNLAENRPKNGLEAAVLYMRMGLPTVPCEGKRPTVKDWPKCRLALEDLPRHFGNGQNIGLLLGERSGGLVVVDIDVLEALPIADWFLPETLVSGRESTPGSHRWYVSPGLNNKKWQDINGVVLLEVRSTGSQTLVEPSVHPDTGEAYAWERDGLLEPVKIDARKLYKRCTELATATVIARHLPLTGGRHEYAKAIIGYLLRRLEEEALLRIVLAAWQAGGGDSPDAVRDLEEIVEDTGRRLAEGDNAFGAPTLEEMVPGLPKLLDRWWGWENRLSQEEKAAPGKGDRKAPTHDTLRDRWLEKQAAPTAYGQSEWRRYGDGYWVSVHEQVVCGEIDEILIEAKAEGIKPTSGIRASIEKLARAKAFVPDEAWDANEDILVCANGTLQISSGILREHRPEDYALSAVPFDYDPEAEAPTWREFLASTVPEASPFLQEFAGYSLTVDTSHELAVWLYGPPGGGKSTLIEGYKAMLGKRAGLLGLADVQRSRFALADLPGKTLVVAAEQPSDFIHSTQLINNIVSGEEIPVERKFRDAFTVTPRAKICWAMNDLPRVKDANSGLFRRVKVVAFPRLRGKPDPQVKERIKAEGAGILNWALEGLHRLRERGRFEIPESVRAATAEFKQSNDVPGTFVEEACITSDSPGCEEQAMDLYRAYHHWCRVSGHHPLSSIKVAAEWRRLGFGSRSLNGKKVYTGVKVDPAWVAAQDDYPKT